MKTQYYTACSLDGFIADAHHSLDWLFQLGNDADADIEAFMAGVGALAMGPSTYEWMLRHHVTPGQPDGQPWPYTLPCWVFSSREQAALPGADIRFVRGDVRPVHAEMAAAAKGRNLWVMGGGELVGRFHDHGLLDGGREDLTAQSHPVTSGACAMLSAAPLPSDGTMTTFASSLKKEIARVARKELKDELGALRKASASYRTEIAALKRQVRELQVALRQTSRRADKALHTVAPDEPADAPKRGRRAVFSAERFKAQRERLGLTQKDMAAYLGTSTLSVWKWETGQVTPRARFLPAILGLRTAGKREVLEQLARTGGGER